MRVKLAKLRDGGRQDGKDADSGGGCRHGDSRIWPFHPSPTDVARVQPKRRDAVGCEWGRREAHGNSCLCVHPTRRQCSSPARDCARRSSRRCLPRLFLFPRPVSAWVASLSCPLFSFPLSLFLHPFALATLSFLILSPLRFSIGVSAASHEVQPLPGRARGPAVRQLRRRPVGRQVPDGGAIQLGVLRVSTPLRFSSLSGVEHAS